MTMRAVSGIAQPKAECLICGFQKQLDTWKENTAIGVCRECHDGALAASQPALPPEVQMFATMMGRVMATDKTPGIWNGMGWGEYMDRLEASLDELYESAETKDIGYAQEVQEKTVEAAILLMRIFDKSAIEAATALGEQT